MAVHEIPASKASLKQNVYEFKLPGSKKVWSLPKVQFLKSDLLDELQDQIAILQPIIEAGEEPTPVQAAALNKIQNRVLDHYCPGLRADLDSDQVVWLLQEWQRFSNPKGKGITLGESSASTDS